jgi:hypothetical protein
VTRGTPIVNTSGRCIADDSAIFHSLQFGLRLLSIWTNGRLLADMNLESIGRAY